ncbi:MAG: ATP-binding protein [Cyanobacteria bacterium P01_D01_bin.44]
MTEISWLEANQRYLMTAVDGVKASLIHHVIDNSGTSSFADQHDLSNEDATLAALAEIATSMDSPPALERICYQFDLSDFERSLLLLCAGPELDASFAASCAEAQGDPNQPHPTFSLALAALPQPNWQAITPDAALRRWHLIDLGPGPTLVTSPLRINERILHTLVGLPALDAQLAGVISPAPAPEELPPSHQAIAERLVTTWRQVEEAANVPVIQLCGLERADKHAIAAMACAMVGLHLHVMLAHTLPTAAADLSTLARLWEREAGLLPGALLLDGDDLEVSDRPRHNALTWFIESVGGPLIITGQERRRARPQHRTLITYDVTKPSAPEQRQLWKRTLDARLEGTPLIGPQLNGQLEPLVAHFDLTAPAIRSALVELDIDAMPLQDEAGPADASARQASMVEVLWETCRVQARPRLDDLAHRIDALATWDGLVLPKAQKTLLREIVIHVRQRMTVYERWGFARQSKRGLGVSALFAGGSGTGKTMAAEVIARELQLDLYRIDLSATVSKYIGETEKNLARVFDAAEAGGTILLFDEADALFGKRSEVKDSHDRHANIEVSYLLQRMESYQGLAILTTNMQDALDPAFLRRLRFIVQFPFPNAVQRTQIWQRIFPSDTPTEALDIEKLARLNMAGGNIRNIALNAAFLAADTDEPVGMNHLLRATRSEYAKLQKPLTEADVKDWIKE